MSTNVPGFQSFFKKIFCIILYWQNKPPAAFLLKEGGTLIKPCEFLNRIIFRNTIYSVSFKMKIFILRCFNIFFYLKDVR